MVTSTDKPIPPFKIHHLLQQHGCPTCRLRSYLLVTVEKENSRISINLFSKRFRNRQTNVSGISSSARVLRRRRNLQGLFYVWSESYCLMLLIYECQWLLKATGGSPGVVHLIKYASQVFRWHFEASRRGPKKTS